MLGGDTSNIFALNPRNRIQQERRVVAETAVNIKYR